MGQFSRAPRRGGAEAPESEVPFVPTGFVAVGRFALPNSIPASFHYEIEAPVGTSVDFGTVAPAFGHFFDSGQTDSITGRLFVA